MLSMGLNGLIPQQPRQAKPPKAKPVAKPKRGETEIVVGPQSKKSYIVPKNPSDRDLKTILEQDRIDAEFSRKTDKGEPAGRLPSQYANRLKTGKLTTEDLFNEAQRAVKPKAERPASPYRRTPRQPDADIAAHIRQEEAKNSYENQAALRALQGPGMALAQMLGLGGAAQQVQGVVNPLVTGIVDPREWQNRVGANTRISADPDEDIDPMLRNFAKANIGIDVAGALSPLVGKGVKGIGKLRGPKPKKGDIDLGLGAPRPPTLEELLKAEGVKYRAELDALDNGPIENGSKAYKARKADIEARYQQAVDAIERRKPKQQQTIADIMEQGGAGGAPGRTPFDLSNANPPNPAGPIPRGHPMAAETELDRILREGVSNEDYRGFGEENPIARLIREENARRAQQTVGTLRTSDDVIDELLPKGNIPKATGADPPYAPYYHQPAQKKAQNLFDEEYPQAQPAAPPPAQKPPKAPEAPTATTQTATKPKKAKSGPVKVEPGVGVIPKDEPVPVRVDSDGLGSYITKERSAELKALGNPNVIATELKKHKAALKKAKTAQERAALQEQVNILTAKSKQYPVIKQTDIDAADKAAGQQFRDSLKNEGMTDAEIDAKLAGKPAATTEPSVSAQTSGGAKPILTKPEWEYEFGEKWVTPKYTEGKFGIVDTDRSRAIAGGKNRKISEANDAAYDKYVDEWQAEGGRLEALSGVDSLGDDRFKSMVRYIQRRHGTDEAEALLSKAGWKKNGNTWEPPRETSKPAKKGVETATEAQPKAKEPWEMTQKEASEQLDRMIDEAESYAKSKPKPAEEWTTSLDASLEAERRTYSQLKNQWERTQMPSEALVKRMNASKAKLSDLEDRSKVIKGDAKTNREAFARAEAEYSIKHYPEWFEARDDYPYRVGTDRYSAVFSHKQAVERALKEGNPVPPEVLADYPDLATKYKTAHIADAGKKVQANPKSGSTGAHKPETPSGTPEKIEGLEKYRSVPNTMGRRGRGGYVNIRLNPDKADEVIARAKAANLKMKDLLGQLKENGVLPEDIPAWEARWRGKAMPAARVAAKAKPGHKEEKQGTISTAESVLTGLSTSTDVPMRALDMSVGGVRGTMAAAESLVRAPVSRLQAKITGNPLVKQDVWSPAKAKRIISGMKPYLKKEAQDLLEGFDEAELERVGGIRGHSLPAKIANAGSLSDVFARLIPRFRMLDDVAGNIAERSLKTRKGQAFESLRDKTFQQLRDKVKPAGVTDDEFKDIMEGALNQELDSSFNNTNFLSQIIDGGVSRLESKIDSVVGKNRLGTELKGATRGGIRLFSRFSRILGNVSLDIANRTPYGLVEGATRIAGSKVAPKLGNISNARRAADITAKSISGTALAALAYAKLPPGKLGMQIRQNESGDPYVYMPPAYEQLTQPLGIQTGMKKRIIEDARKAGAITQVMYDKMMLKEVWGLGGFGAAPGNLRSMSAVLDVDNPGQAIGKAMGRLVPGIIKREGIIYDAAQNPRSNVELQDVMVGQGRPVKVDSFLGGIQRQTAFKKQMKDKPVKVRYPN